MTQLKILDQFEFVGDLPMSFCSKFCYFTFKFTKCTSFYFLNIFIIKISFRIKLIKTLFLYSPLIKPYFYIFHCYYSLNSNLAPSSCYSLNHNFTCHLNYFLYPLHVFFPLSFLHYGK